MKTPAVPAPRVLVFLSLLAASALAAAPATAQHADAWAVPAPDDCDRARIVPLGEALDAPVDASADREFPLEVGQIVEVSDAPRLRDLVPAEVWEERDRFFFDGMQLEVGPCFRDYAPPAFFRAATEAHAGRAKLDDAGRLVGHVAGLPFPPERIDPKAPDAARKWAWNWVHRYQGAGTFGRYRLTTVAKGGQVDTWRGESWQVQLRGRADRDTSDYRHDLGIDALWAGGGVLRNLSTGDECGFRQYGTGGRRPDLFVLCDSSRKVERAIAPDAEQPLSGVAVGLGGNLFLHGGSPQLHDWKLVGVRDVIAPINAREAFFPDDPDRGFGPAGLSFANDRWELRRALVLEGQLREGRFEDRVRRFVWYLDLQTLAPLYYVAYRDEGEKGGVGYFVHRFSEDRSDYPSWPDDAERPRRILDEVGLALVDWNDRSVVRGERWDSVGVPPPDRKLKRQVSQATLRAR